MERYELQAYKVKTGYNLGQLELDYYQHFFKQVPPLKYMVLKFSYSLDRRKC
jgi:hypothetical protein